MILENLRTEWDALVSCSLACKALFCSARRVIHERLCVVGPKTFPFAVKLTGRYWIFNRTHLRRLSLADDANLTQYTRHLVVVVGQAFTPRGLRPYAQTLRKYTCLTSLTLTHFDPLPFLPVFDRYFLHLSHSLRSLHLVSPRGTPDVAVDFISRFLNLDNLEFNPVPEPPHQPSGNQTSLEPRSQLAPLRGTLRIISTDSRGTISLEPLVHLPGGLHFRSFEFVCCTDINTTGIVRECASTLETVTYTLHCRKSASLANRFIFAYPLLILVLTAPETAFFKLQLGPCRNLRIFEARIETSSFALDDLIRWLVGVLSTIRSPVFSEFILSLDYKTFEPHIHEVNPTIISILDRRVSRLRRRSGMRLIIKSDLPEPWRQLLLFCLPSSTSVCAIRFDLPDSSVLLCGQTR